MKYKGKLQRFALLFHLWTQLNSAALFCSMSPRNQGSDISKGLGSSTKGQMYFSLSPNLFKMIYCLTVWDMKG